jgi:hypothetical protein
MFKISQSISYNVEYIDKDSLTMLINNNISININNSVDLSN